MICFWKGKNASLLYDLSFSFRCCMIYIWKGKTLLLRNDLSLKRKNFIVAVRYVLNSAKFYFTSHFSLGIPCVWIYNVFLVRAGRVSAAIINFICNLKTLSFYGILVK